MKEILPVQGFVPRVCEKGNRGVKKILPVQGSYRAYARKEIEELGKCYRCKVCTAHMRERKSRSEENIAGAKFMPRICVKRNPGVKEILRVQGSQCAEAWKDLRKVKRK